MWSNDQRCLRSFGPLLNHADKNSLMIKTSASWITELRPSTRHQYEANRGSIDVAKELSLLCAAHCTGNFKLRPGVFVVWNEWTSTDGLLAARFRPATGGYFWMSAAVPCCSWFGIIHKFIQNMKSPNHGVTYHTSYISYCSPLAMVHEWSFPLVLM